MTAQQGFDLKDFLAQQRSEGTTDSEGTFTVSKEKALTKLARFALPGETDWVLKVVQAVNAWNCPKLVIQQTRVATSFYFCPPDQATFPTDEVLVKSLTTGVGGSQTSIAVDELCMALRSLVDQIGLSFVLAIRRHGELGKPIFAGDDTSKMDAQTREQWANLEVEGLRLTVSHFKKSEGWLGRYIPTFSNIERRDISIYQILHERAFASETPIFVDGREITNLAYHPSLVRKDYFRPLLSGRDVGDGFSTRVYPMRSWNFTRPSFFNQPSSTNNRVFITTSNWMNLDRMLDWTPDYKFRSNMFFFEAGSHRAFWLRHGVVVQSNAFSNPTLTRVLLFLNADDVRSDLSGLALQLDESSHQRVVSGMLAVGQLIAAGESHIRKELSADRKSTDDNDGELQLDLEAGYSVFTESLQFGQNLSSLAKFFKKRKRARQIRKSTKDHLVEPWFALLKQEFKTITNFLTTENLQKRISRSFTGNVDLSE